MPEVEWLEVTYEEKGFRDVRWCNAMNEPVIIEYRPKPIREPYCTMCKEPMDMEEHPFICHILKK